MVHINFIRKKLSLPLKIFFLLVCVFCFYLMTKKNFPQRRKTTESKDTKPTKLKISTGEENIQGYFNIHRWDSLCGTRVDILRDNVFFPKLPNWRSFVNISKSETNSKNFGQRIFGYIYPPSSGFYKFSISSDDFSELWLSSNDNPNNASLISYVGGRENGTFVFGWTKPGEFNKYKSQRSANIFLKKGRKYFLEILHKQGDGLAHVHVIWKLPGSGKFIDIKRKYMSSYEGKGESAHVLDFDLLRQHKVKRSPGRKYNISYSSKALYFHDLHKLLPKCVSSDVKKRVPRFNGVYMVHTASVYPADGSNNIIEVCQWLHYKEECNGNPTLDKKYASRIVHQFLKEALPKNYSLKSVINIEQFKTSHSPIQQFFVDVEVINKNNGKVMRIAEQVWTNSSEKTFCSPLKTSWNPDVMIYVIVTVKDQGLWLRRFVDTMVYIQEEGKDNNIHPIIVDFGSHDVGPNDTEIYLEKSKLNHHTVLHKTGKFYKTAAINEAAASVKNNNSILFQLDLHLDLPLNLMETVRQHTIQGKVAFTPILTRLMCGSNPDFPIGYWEEQGYGLFAVYKSDWIKFGGMNEKEFGTTWGGEDWELIDRVISNNIAVQKIKVPRLYHYYHRRKRLWQNAM